MSKERDWPHEIHSAMSGSGTWFTSDLLRLIAKADVDNKSRLRAGFPEHVAAYDRWQASEGEFTREVT